MVCTVNVIKAVDDARRVTCSDIQVVLYRLLYGDNEVGLWGALTGICRAATVWLLLTWLSTNYVVRHL